MSDFIKITFANGDKMIAHKSKIQLSEPGKDGDFIFITDCNKDGIAGYRIEKKEYERICKLLEIE